METYEDFKRAFTLFENVLRTDHTDASVTFKDLVNWYNHYRFVESVPDKKSLFYNDALPVIIRNALNRKYANNPEHIAYAQTFFESTGCFLAVSLHLEYDGIAEALKELLDPNQPFYSKYGFPEMAPAEVIPEVIQPHDETLIASMDSGECLDFQNDDGKWEVVMVESLSPYRTEVQLRFIQNDDNTTKWFSIAKYAHRFAAPFTRSSNLAGNAAEDQNPPNVHDSVDSSIRSTDVNMTETDMILGPTYNVKDIEWKYSLNVGDLIDVKDPNGVWYQACVIEVKLNSDIPRVYTKSDTSDGNAELVNDKEPSLACDPKSKRARKSNNSSPLESNKNETTEIIAQDSMDAADLSYIPNQKENENNDADRDMYCEPLNLEAINIQLMKSIRVSYLGFPEKNDELLSLNSDRIQIFNTKSNRRRGENPIREEILFITKQIPTEEENSAPVVLRQSCFLSHYYVSVVHCFAVNSGFDNVLTILCPEKSSSADSMESSETTFKFPISLQRFFSIAIAAGNAHQVLSKSLLSRFGETFAMCVTKRLFSMSLPEIRLTPMESIEPVIKAVEHIAIATFGKTKQGGQCYERAYLELAVRYLLSPYLNRRLGGLKLLSDLVKRGLNTSAYPNGVKLSYATKALETCQINSMNGKTSRSDSGSEPIDLTAEFASESKSIKPFGPLLPPTQTDTETLSLKVVPILYDLTVEEICIRIVIENILRVVFTGELSHGSLMERAGELVKAMSITGHLDGDLLDIFWDVAFVQKETKAWKILNDLVVYAPPSTIKLLFERLSSIQPTLVTKESMDLLGILSTRTRDILLNTEVIANGCDVEEVLALNRRILNAMWIWCSDLSGAGDAVVIQGLQLFESALGIGISFAASQERTNFPWDRQWLRAADILNNSLSSLRKFDSVTIGIKVILSFLNSWPIKANPKPANIHEISNSLPFSSITRFSVASYLESVSNVMQCTASSIVHLKCIFDTESEKHLLALSKFHMNDEVLPQSVQNTLNDMIIPGTRVMYKDFLSRLIDFFFVFGKNCEDSELSLDHIKLIWTNIVGKAKTSTEVDLMVKLIQRITLNQNRKSTKSQNNSSPASEINDMIADDQSVNNIEDIITVDKSPKSINQKYFCSPVSLTAIFKDLFCDQRFITSSFFNDSAYCCTEKLFILINSSENLIIEYKNKNLGFSIIGPPDKLLLWEIFFDIAILTPVEAVAIKSMKFVASFPQKLSQSLVESGEIHVMRRKLLDHAMFKLKALKPLSLNEKLDPLSDSTRQIKRCLLLLNEILEEASYDSRNLLRPHGYLSMGGGITFKINSQSRLSKYNGMTFEVSPNDSIDDLLGKLFKVIERKSSEILRVVVRAKDLLTGDRRKLVSQLGNISPVESVMIVDKPASSIKSSESASNPEKSVRFHENSQVHDTLNVGNSADSTDTSLPPIIEVSNLPAMILSQSPEYINSLFEFLDISSGALCDEIWLLLNRLPTSPSILRSLLGETTTTLNMTSLIFGLSSRTNTCGLIDEFPSLDNISSSRLLYVLVIVEYLIQPVENESKSKDIEHLFKDISEQALSDWPRLFFQRGGAQAIQDVLVFIMTLCPSGDSGQSFFINTPIVGYSLDMLLSAIRLSTRFARTIAIHTSAFQLESQRKLLVIIKEAEILKNSALDTTAPKPSSEAENASMITEASENKLLQSEWGWRLSFIRDNPDLQNTYFKSELNGYNFQSIALKLVSFSRQFSKNINMFGLRKHASSAERTAVNRRYEALFESLNNIFVVWATAISIHPNILSFLTDKQILEFEESNSNLPRIELSALLNRILLGIFPSEFGGLNIESNDQLLLNVGFINEVETKVGNWFGSACESILKIAEESQAKLFCESLLIALINIRPQVTVTRSLDNKDNIYQTMFALMKKLLHDQLNALSNYLTDDKRLQISSDIFEELKAAHIDLNSSINSEVQFISHAEGTIDLLACLARGHQHVLQYLYSNNLLEFLFMNCLGFKIPSRSSEQSNEGRNIVLCHTNESRDSAYALIESLCEWNQDVTAEILLFLHPIHEAVSTPTQWGYDPQSDALSSTGYVGLRNMGCTCYMNSLLQVLYMIPQFRNAVLSSNIPQEFYSDFDLLRNSYVAQLQKMFLNLQLGKRKAFSPDDWAYCYKDDNGANPINVLHQQDAQEFLQVLFDRLEISYKNLQSYSKSTDNSSASQGFALKDKFSGLFGGVLCDQMIKDTTSNASLSLHENLRERTDTFVCISVDVKGSKGLEESLYKFIQGEQISDYQWDESGPKSSITKRQVIADLSDTLIFHLKRFELNFDTFMREKVNDTFTFPFELDMYPYTRACLMGAPDSERSPQYYKYQLKAIVVHTGTADSGHYFSYIKESKNQGQTAKWIEFNDSLVKEFPEDQIQSQCFGGTVSTFHHFQGTHVESQEPNPQSAYMLIYQRVESESIDDSIQTSALECLSTMHMDVSEPSEENLYQSYPTNQPSYLPPLSPSYESIVRQEIRKSNNEYFLSSQVLSSSHIKFLSSIASTMKIYLTSDQMRTSSKLMNLYCQTIIHDLCLTGLRLVSRSSQLPLIKTYFLNLIEVMSVKHSTNDAEDKLNSNSQTNLSSYFFGNLKATNFQNSMTRNDLTVPGVSLAQFIDWTAIPKLQTAATQVLATILQDINTLLISGIYCFTQEIRQSFADVVFLLFKRVYEKEGHDQWPNDFSIIRKDSISFAYTEAMIPGLFKNSISIDDNPEDDLERAIRLSQESFLSTPPAPQIPKTEEQVSFPLCFQFLLELTTTTRLQLIAENWRRSESMTRLLLQLTNHHNSVRNVFILREIVAHAIDIVLGEQSPLMGTLYERKGRKFAPSSYALVYPVKPPPGFTEQLSSSSLSVPNWSSMLEMVSVLIGGAHREDLSNPRFLPSFGLGGYQQNAMTPNAKQPLVLSEWDLKCVNCRTFYSTCLRQSRYAPFIRKILLHRCYGSVFFSDLIAEVLLESLSLATVESTYHLFEMLETYAGIDDSISVHRSLKMFSPTQSGIIDLLASMKEQSIRAKFLCVCLWSVLVIMGRNRRLIDSLANPRSAVDIWGPWMMKFCFQFSNKCAKEQEINQTASLMAAKNDASDVQEQSKPLLGPYLIVFGDSESDRELSWASRADRTFSLLQQIISSIGFQPDALLPESAFIESLTPEPTPTAATAGVVADELFDYNDGISEEELQNIIATLD